MNRPGPRSHYRIRPNLLVQGFEAAAEIVSERVRKQRGAQFCYVLDNGDVVLQPTCDQRASALEDRMLVGTYSRATLVEHIEDDLIERQRELVDTLLQRANQANGARRRHDRAA